MIIVIIGRNRSRYIWTFLLVPRNERPSPTIKQFRRPRPQRIINAPSGARSIIHPYGNRRGSAFFQFGNLRGSHSQSSGVSELWTAQGSSLASQRCDRSGTAIRQHPPLPVRRMPQALLCVQEALRANAFAAAHIRWKRSRIHSASAAVASSPIPNPINPNGMELFSSGFRSGISRFPRIARRELHLRHRWISAPHT